METALLNLVNKDTIDYFNLRNQCLLYWKQHPFTDLVRQQVYNEAQKHCLKCIIKSINDKNIATFHWLLSISGECELVRQFLVYYEVKDKELNIEVGLYGLCNNWLEGFALLCNYPTRISMHQFSRLMWIACLYPENGYLQVMKVSRYFVYMSTFMQGIAYHILCITGYYADWYELFRKFYQSNWWSPQECIAAIHSTQYLTKEGKVSVRSAWDFYKLCKYCKPEALHSMLERRSDFVKQCMKWIEPLSSSYGENKDCIPSKKDMQEQTDYLMTLH
jgi:hypothetical protein